MPLGEDYDLSGNERVARDGNKLNTPKVLTTLTSKHLRLVSGGVDHATRLLTSDGVDLTPYGLVAAVWSVQAGEDPLLTVSFYGANVDIAVENDRVVVQKVACTCGQADFGPNHAQGCMMYDEEPDNMDGI